MTNVSKKKLSNKTEERLFSELAHIFAVANKQQTKSLFADLFTPAEKIMFIKRLAIILMLHRNQSTYSIAKLLKVSDATVRRIRKAYEQGVYDHIISITKNKNFDNKEFWKTLEVVLRLGMPSYGKDRWKGFGFTD